MQGSKGGDRSRRKRARSVEISRIEYSFFFFFLGKRIVSRGWNGTEVKRNFEVEDM